MLALFFLFTSGCHHTACNWGNEGMEPNSQAPISGTYLFVSQCQNISEYAPDDANVEFELVLAALAESAVTAGIELIGKALKNAAADKVDTTIASLNLQSIATLKGTKNPQCMQIVRAEFEYVDDTNKECINCYKYPDISFVTGSDTSQKIKTANLAVKENTEELFAELLPILAGNTISFVPLELRYSGQTPSDKKHKKPRDLAMFVGFSFPENDVTTGDYSGRLINFGPISPPKNGQAIIKYLSKNKPSMLKQTQWLSLPEGSTDKPITIAVNVIETEKANKLVKILSKAFESNEEQLEKQAAEALAKLEILKTSEQIKQEQIASAKAKLDAESKYIVALVEVNTKRAELDRICKTDIPDTNAVKVAEMTLNLSINNAILVGKAADHDTSDLKTVVANGDCSD